MPCYNRADSVRRAVESVLAQTYSDLELVVVDDASTDGTPEILSQIATKDARVRVVLRDHNGGPGAARNTGISAAQGEWIAVIDSDDWYEPQRLQVLLDEAERDGAVVVADNQIFVREGADHPTCQLRAHGTERVQRLTPYDLLEGDRWGRMTNLGLLKPIVKRQFLEDSGIRYDEEIGIGEDFYFLLKCTQQASYMLFVAEPLYFYQIRKGSLGSSPTVESVVATQVMHERCCQLFQGKVDPSMRKLMEKRGHDLGDAVRYKRLIAPIKTFDLNRSVKQFLSDPSVLPFVFRMALLHIGRQFVYLKGSWR
jgi:succinoglycan biosynthesis protein ExoO